MQEFYNTSMISFDHYDHANSIAILLAQDFTILKINPYAANLLGWQQKNILRHSFFQLLTASSIEYDASIIPFIERFISGIFEFDIYLAQKKIELYFNFIQNQNTRYVIVTEKNITTQQSSSVGAGIIDNQINHLIQQYQSVIPQNIHLLIQQLMTFLPACIHIKDANNFQYLNGNQAFIDFYQFNTPHEYRNKTIFDIAKNMRNRWSRETPDEIHQKELALINTNTPLIGHMETYLDSKGYIINNSLNKIPLLNHMGEPYAILTIAINHNQLLDKITLRQLYQKLYLNKKLALHYFLQHLNLTKFIQDQSSFRESISNRELDCLILLATGKSFKAIGEYLSISARTVESHIEHIKQKCGFDTTAEMLNEFAKHYFA